MKEPSSSRFARYNVARYEGFSELASSMFLKIRWIFQFMFERIRDKMLRICLYLTENIIRWLVFFFYFAAKVEIDIFWKVYQRSVYKMISSLFLNFRPIIQWSDPIGISLIKLKQIKRSNWVDWITHFRTFPRPGIYLFQNTSIK